MANNFHITKDGPKPCNAQIKCPVGGSHFSDEKEAQKVYESKMNKTHEKGLKKLFKKYSSNTVHLKNIEKRLKQNEQDFKDRDERQKDGTVYDQLLKNGITDEELNKMLKLESAQREGGLSTLANKKGDKEVIGVSYNADSKYEEEEGLRKIEENLREGKMTKESVAYEVIDGKGVFSISSDPNGMSGYKENSLREAIHSFNKWEKFDMEELREEMKLNNKSVSELRENLKGKVKPLPKNRKDLVKATVKYNNGTINDKVDTPPQGYFQTGRVLTIVSDNEVMKKSFEKMKEANDTGNLRMGTSKNPFSHGSIFYDDRDVSRESKTKEIKQEEVDKAMTERIAPTVDKLKEISRYPHVNVTPRSNEDINDLRNGRYWVDFTPKNLDKEKYLTRSSDNVFGYFNETQINQMIAGDYSEMDKRNREAKDKGHAF